MTSSASSELGGPLHRGPNVLWRRAAGTALLLGPDADQPLVLSGSGAALWEALGQSVPEDALVDSLARTFNVTADTLRDDVHEAVTDLVARGLVETG